MSAVPSNDQPDSSNGSHSQIGENVDIVGGPWAIIESDPGIFTSVMQKLGIKRCEAAEVYSIEPDGLSHLNQIHGLVFCSQVQTESPLNMHDLTEGASGSEDVDFNEIWFANQLIHNACATQAILNVIFNCSELDIGSKLRDFKDFTRNMGPKMKGLALSNDPGIREIHNSMARPADLQDALHGLAKRTALTESEKKRAAERAKRKNKPSVKKKKKAEDDEEEDDDTEGDTVYHYVGYVPFKGKVWELDGLRVGPLEVGEIPSAAEGNDDFSREWLEVVRPAIRIKIESLQGSGHDIRFNLLALVEGGWEKRSDEFELLRRERKALERRLDGLDLDWKAKLTDVVSYSTVEATFSAREDPGGFDPSFGYRSNERNMRILHLPVDQLIPEWLRCHREAQSVTMLLGEEQEKAQTWATESSKRTHDFKPFLQAFVEALHQEGHLLPALGLGDSNSGESNVDASTVQHE